MDCPSRRFALSLPPELSGGCGILNWAKGLAQIVKAKLVA